MSTVNVTLTEDFRADVEPLWNHNYRGPDIGAPSRHQLGRHPLVRILPAFTYEHIPGSTRDTVEQLALLLS
ncbi:MAG: hypothetical protein ACRDQ4_06095 [Pseudonocardiaceae bacterium]